MDISMISKGIIPEGTLISTISPTFFPIRPLAMGVLTAIFPMFQIRFIIRYDGIFHQGIIFRIPDLHPVHDLYPFRINFRTINNPGTGNGIFELVDFHFKHALRFFGSFIFSIFRQITLIPCFCNQLGNGRSLNTYKMIEFIFKFLKSFFGNIRNFCS